MIRSDLSSRQTFWAQLLLVLALGFILAGACVFLPGSQARAQVIIATVNGDPITDIDVNERMKLLRVLHQPATHDAALESMIDDQLKLQETSQFKVKASDSQIGEQIAKDAGKMKIAPQALLEELQSSGILESNFKEYFAAEFQFLLLVEAYNKGVDASETEVRAELAKDGGKAAAGTEYKIRQIIFAVFSSTATPNDVEQKMKAAEQLRTRFTDCASGIPLAEGMDDVAIKDQLTRNSLQLSDSVKDLLDKTPVGHLTPPERTTDGIEMIAVCAKGASEDDTALRDAISQRLLAAEMEADAAKRLKELRSEAVVVVKK
jgi:peptidyl-prolyl cis-trans isomerase SurA